MAKTRQNSAAEDVESSENEGLFEELSALTRSFEECKQRFGWGSAFKRVVQAIFDAQQHSRQAPKCDFHADLTAALAGLNQTAEKFGVRYESKISDVKDISHQYEAKEAELTMQVQNVERFSEIVFKLIARIEAEKDRSRNAQNLKMLDDFIGPFLDEIIKTDDPKKLESDQVNVQALNRLVEIGLNHHDFLWKIASLVPAVYEELSPQEASRALMSFFDFEKNLSFKIKRIPRGDTNLKHLREADSGFRYWISRAGESLGSRSFAIYVQRMKEAYAKALDAFIRQHAEWESKKHIITYFPEENRDAVVFAKERAKDLKYCDMN